MLSEGIVKSGRGAAQASEQELPQLRRSGSRALWWGLMVSLHDDVEAPKWSVQCRKIMYIGMAYYYWKRQPC